MSNKPYNQYKFNKWVFENPKSICPKIYHNGILKVYPRKGRTLIFKQNDEKPKTGTYGTVTTYVCENLKVVIKSSKKNKQDRNEQRAVEILTEYNRTHEKKHPLVPCRNIQMDDNNYVTMMPYLKDFYKLNINHLSINNIRVLLNEIRRQLNFVLSLNTQESLNSKDQRELLYAYCDIKFGNTLFEFVDKDIKIYLGDVGSITNVKNPGTFISTYAPQTAQENGSMSRLPKKFIVNAMRFLFGLFAFKLINYKDCICKSPDFSKPVTKEELIMCNKILIKKLGKDFGNLIYNIHSDKLDTTV